jgi:hypothetical protein
MTTINAQINPSTKIVAKNVTLHDVTAASVGLANVDNTSDLNKPVSTAQQSALDLKADQATTYTKVEVDSNIANLVDTAPATLDTLNELAAALGDDANFAATTASALGEKLAKANNLSDLANAATARTNLELGSVEDKSSATIRGEIVDSDIPSTITRDTDLNTALDLKANLASPSFTGNVGIGTTTPAEALDVNGSIKVTPVTYAGNQDAYILKSGASNNASWDGMGFKLKSDSTGEPFMTAAYHTGTDTMTWKGSRVGIGTTTPSEALDVSGNIKVSGETKFDKIVRITPESGLGLQLFSSGSNNSAVSLQVQGPVTVGHDLFQRSGFTNGFGDGSNHFHSLIDINRIEQEPSGDVHNTKRVQERYYAIPTNNLPNNKAVFWAQHRVARPISAAVVDTSAATLDVSLLQDSTNRSSSNQVFFVSNSTPLNKSEELTITLNSHSLSSGNSVRMTFGQAFQGPIVAAALFGKVIRATTNTFDVELYGGNYKTTSEVPDGNSQTALTFDEVTLETIGTDTVVQNGNETELQLYSKTNFTPNRLKDETLKATWSVAHGLVKNEHCTLITDARGDLEIKQSAYVLDPDPDGDGLSVILVYGRRIKQFDLSSFTAFGSTNWTLHKGSIDGIHDDTLGDNLINFNANNHGDYTAYQIGPGSQTDADCIAIGKNVYNKDASTIKIGYDNAMLDVRSDGIVVDGNISASGTLQASNITPNGDSHLLIKTNDDTGNGITIQTGTNATSSAGNIIIKAGSGLGGGDIDFFTDAGHAVRIDSSGAFLAGGAGTPTLFVTKSTGGSTRKNRVSIGTGDLPEATLDVGGNVLISESLDVGGNVLISESLKIGSGKELKEYDYGTFTPKLALNGTTEQSAYAKQEGYYVKIGRVVTVNIIIKVTHFDSAFKTAGTNDEIGIIGLPHSAKIEGSDGPDTMIVQVHPRKGWQNLGDNSYSGSVGTASSGVIFFEKNVGQGEFGPAPGAGVGWNYERIKVNDFHLHPFNFTADGVKAFTFQISGTYITDDDV